MYLLAEYWSWWVGYFSSIVVPVLAWQSSTARPTGKVAPPPFTTQGWDPLIPGMCQGWGQGWHWIETQHIALHCTTPDTTTLYSNVITIIIIITQHCILLHQPTYWCLDFILQGCRWTNNSWWKNDFFFSVFWGQIWPPTKLVKNVLRFLLKDYWNTIEALFRDERRHPKSIGSYWFLELFACSMSR